MGIDYLTRYPKNQSSSSTPVLILAPTGRCCTTLLQRWLSTHPDIWIWGEPHIIRPVENMILAKFQHYPPHVLKSNETFEVNGLNGWVPNLNPEHDFESVVECIRTLYYTFYKPITRYWGFKEILVDPRRFVQYRQIFPDAKIIVPFRQLDKIRKSFESKKHWWPGHSWDFWEACYTSLKSYVSTLDDPSVLLIHDINAELDNLKSKLERFLGIVGLDESFLDRKISE